MNVELLGGDAAWAMLNEPAAQRAWDECWANCPWATVFQGRPFAAAWYNVYRDAYEPLLALSRGAGGELAGLLALAVEKQTPRVVAAGDKQAEYQVWIARAGAAGDFPPAALEAVRRQFPRRQIVLRYLPPGTPMGWLIANPLRSVCNLTACRRPLLRLGDGGGIAASLAKKSNRSRLKRLATLGHVRVELVVQADALANVLDEIARDFDARQAAAHGVTPFAADGRKKAFYLELARAGLLHATALLAGDTMAAAHLGVCDRSTVHLGIIAHRAGLERHSPGKLLLLLLAARLARDGFATLDLTPGGDAYKERFANDHDEVHKLILFPTPAARAMHDGKEAILAAGRRVLKPFGIQPAAVKAALRRLLGR